MTQTARVAPVVFAKTSMTSPLLVVVHNPCTISIPIPKKTERTNDKPNGLMTFRLFNCFLKNKNQNKVNTK